MSAVGATRWVRRCLSDELVARNQQPQARNDDARYLCDATTKQMSSSSCLITNASRFLRLFIRNASVTLTEWFLIHSAPASGLFHFGMSILMEPSPLQGLHPDGQIMPTSYVKRCGEGRKPIKDFKCA